MTNSERPHWKKRTYRAIGWIILISAVLAVPHTHGWLQYVGLLLAALFLIAVDYALFGREKKPYI